MRLTKALSSYQDKDFARHREQIRLITEETWKAGCCYTSSNAHLCNYIMLVLEELRRPGSFIRNVTFLAEDESPPWGKKE